MDILFFITRFFLGAAIGSFLNVLAVRYDPDKPLFGRHATGGRSHCPHCGKTLRAYELVPFVSFFLQRGRCRSCGARLSIQYVAAEVLAGALFAFAPLALHGFFLTSPWELFFSVLWIAAFSILILLSLIDVRLQIIPDETVIILAVLGALHISGEILSGTHLSFVRAYAYLFGFMGPLASGIVGAFVGAVFFGALIAITRGRGMGVGDMKLAAALGLLFGWPDIGLLVVLSFIVGSAAALVQIARKRRSMKQFLAFGPFLAAGAVLVFALGSNILDFYFSIFRVQ